MISEEEVKQGLVRVENVGPPLVKDEHSEDTESSLDPDLVEDLIPDEDVEPSLVEEITPPNVRPLDWRFFSSVRDYVKGQLCFPTDKPLSAVVAHEPRDRKVFDIFFWSDRRRRVLEVSLPEVLSSNESEPPVIVEDYSHRHRRAKHYEVRGLSSVTVKDDHGRSRKIIFCLVPRNKNFFLRLSDPSSYEHRKSLFLWRAVTYIRSLILNPNLLWSVLEEAKSYTPKPENERMTKQFGSKLTVAETQKQELQVLLGEARWTEHYLVSVKGSNVLARQIWHALRGIPTGLMEDVLEELRTRFKRGRIWENDPWWPNDH